ncbi:uncharacterized protein LOC115242802 [Formica exsecta]|uniref:uncharacterized protein LOC115242802 n=1 Tax=Formica exsecta TaxID=72781 RepID=UPI001145007D|nr:uncharacterized protein LOC115242802 [Formica exsecta]
MSDILSIGGEPVFDDRIVKIETHTYNHYANTTFGNSDEIRIPIQQDLYTLPCESFLYVEGRLESKKPSGAEGEGAPATRLMNNCAAFMFEEICYELDVEIDRSRNVGINEHDQELRIADGRERQDITERWMGLISNNSFADRRFQLLRTPQRVARFLRGLQARHTVANASYSAKRRVNKLTLLRTLDSRRYLSVAFRSRDLYEFPLLQSTTKHSWVVKAAMQLGEPRYVIFALQSGRKNVLSEEPSLFADCKLTNIKLYLNSDFYLYNDMNLNFEKRKVAVLYDMYSRFRRTYNRCDNDEALLNLKKFLVYGPLVVIDYSRQNESIKSATVDVRIEFDCKENVLSNTTAYCLISHDRVVEYNPLANVVHRIV